jgi:hypothetical protein
MLSLVMAVPVVFAPTVPAAHAAEDPCPEPNDTFQAACFLGGDDDAFGYLSRPDDSDAYRIEVLDFNAVVRVNLLERPFPYKVELVDWAGRVIVGSGPDGKIDTIVGPPGAYYLFVHSPTGQISSTAPYRLNREILYPSAETPDILYSNELRFGAEPEKKVDTGAEYSSDGSKFTIRMLTEGTPDDAKVAVSMWGPELSDFLLTTDTRMESQGVAGYHIFFRADGDYGYVLFVTAAQIVALGRISPESTDVIASAFPKTLDLKGGVNRTTIRAVGDDIRIWINGEPVIQVKDDASANGRFGFGAATSGAPPTVTFDNIMATTPGGGS